MNETKDLGLEAWEEKKIIACDFVWLLTSGFHSALLVRIIRVFEGLVKKKWASAQSDQGLFNSLIRKCFGMT